MHNSHGASQKVDTYLYVTSSNIYLFYLIHNANTIPSNACFCLFVLHARFVYWKVVNVLSQSDIMKLLTVYHGWIVTLKPECWNLTGFLYGCQRYWKAGVSECMHHSIWHFISILKALVQTSCGAHSCVVVSVWDWRTRGRQFKTPNGCTIGNSKQRPVFSHYVSVVYHLSVHVTLSISP